MAKTCKFYLQGRCQRGQHCRFSHTGRPILTATAIKQPPTVQEFVPGTVTAVLGDFKVTFTAGVVPLDIDPSYGDGKKPQIASLQSSLRVTWYEPTRPVWLEFDNQEAARRARDILDGKQLLGATLKAKINTGTTDWTVAVTGLNFKITKDDMANALPADARPKKMFLEPFNYDPKISGADEVRKHICANTAFKIVREEEHKKVHSSKSCREYVFEGNPNLEAVAKAIDGAVISKMGKSKIYAQEVLCLKLSVKTEAYVAKKSQVAKIASDAWKISKVKVRMISGAHDTKRTTIEVFAEKRSQLAAVKAQMDGLFGHIEEKIKFSFGKAGMQTHRLRLTKTSAYKEAKKTFDSVLQAFGDGVATFDDDSESPAILVKGDSSVLRAVQKHLQGDKPTPASKKRACDMCMDDDVDESAQLETCKHVGCRDCVLRHCTTRPDDGSRVFPLRCFEPGCDKPLSLRQVRSLLSEEALKLVLEESLSDHMQRHPEEFAKCPGKDGCSKSYRKSASENARQLCSGCLTSYCAHCNAEYHVGMSCSER